MGSDYDGSGNWLFFAVPIFIILLPFILYFLLITVPATITGGLTFLGLDQAIMAIPGVSDHTAQSIAQYPAIIVFFITMAAVAIWLDEIGLGWG